jgi:hypothetical protein
VTTASPDELLAMMGEPLDPDAYDWSLAADGSLTSDEVFQLTYAAQVEWATEGTFDSLDITDDTRVKRFLRTWLAQEVVHGQLLARFLHECGHDAPPLHDTVRQRFAARRGRWVNRAVHRLVGDDFFAVHMTWGAVNELMTLRFYAVMRAATRNALLGTLLRDLIAQEVLHYRFYRTMAAARLDGNMRAQRLVRWTLEHLWSPVGTGLRGRADGDRLVLGLVAERAEVVAGLDETLERIPGLERLALVAREVDRARDRRHGRGPLWARSPSVAQPSAAPPHRVTLVQASARVTDGDEPPSSTSSGSPVPSAATAQVS